MIYDFSQICKAYSKNKYSSREYFTNTPCPVCPAIGRFNLHSSYSRHIIFFNNGKLVHLLMEIKRVKCVSCKSTHAVMPGDIIPYRLLSLFVFIFILVHYYLKKTPALKIADMHGFSFQYVYSSLHTFKAYLNDIRQYIREVSPSFAKSTIEVQDVLKFIQKSRSKFQSGYINLNRKACFMCRFRYKNGGPATGIFTAMLPLQGQQHSL